MRLCVYIYKSVFCGLTCIYIYIYIYIYICIYERQHYLK